MNNLWAMSWTSAPSVGMEVSHTDNVNLTKDGKEDLIYRLSPGIQLSGEGRRLSVNINYQLNVTGFAEHSSGDGTTNSLSSQANMAFIKNLFFLDLSANINQRAIDNSSAVDQQQLSITDNYSEAVTTTVSPYIDTVLGRSVRLLFRYTHSRLTYDESTLADRESETVGVIAAISSLPGSGRFSWSLNYSGSEVDYSDNDADARLEQVEARVSITPFHGWNFSAFVGDEFNDYETASSNDGDTEGEFYGLGIEWRPTEATRINIMGRSGYSGDSATVELEHDSGKTLYSFNYSEAYSTDAQVDSGRDGSLVYQNIGAISRGVFLQKRASLSIKKRFIRSNLIFEMQSDEREDQHTDSEERTVSARLQWDRRLSRRTDLLLQGSWSETELALSDREDELSGAGVLISHTFGRRTTGTLAYDWLSRSSSDSSAEYQRNLLTAGLRINF